MASLHVNLLALHSLILLTRQLFVMHNWMLVEQRSGKKKPSPIHESPMARFSEACVLASYQTIQLVQQAREEQHLPRRNPFFIYFVFAASLVILMNQFSSLYFTKAYAKTIADAIGFMEYCTELDPQAERVLDIINRFAKVVDKWTKGHTHDAPPLSEDLSFLYSQASSPQPEPLLSGGAVVASPFQEQDHPHPHHRPSSRVVSGIATTALPHDPGLLTPPTMSKMPLSDILTPPQPPSGQDTRMDGMSPPLPAAIAAGPQQSVHAFGPRGSIPQQNESPGYNREIEFDFDNLWNNWLNLPGPAIVSTPAVPVPVPSQFSPVAAAAAVEPFPGAYASISPSIPSIHAHPVAVSGPSPSIHLGRVALHHHQHHGNNIPLYHSSSSFG
jgi:hypothetical protein